MFDVRFRTRCEFPLGVRCLPPFRCLRGHSIFRNFMAGANNGGYLAVTLDRRRMIARQILSAFERIFPEPLPQPTLFPLAA